MDGVMRSIVYFLGYAIAVLGGNLLVDAVLSRMGAAPGAGGLRGAGAVIGMLERALVVTFVYAGEFAATAVIFAAKSIIRFESARQQRAFAEYFLIGSLTSILCAVLIAMAAVQIALLFE